MENILLRLKHWDVIYTLLQSCFWHLLDYKSWQAKQKNEASEKKKKFRSPFRWSFCVPWIVKYDFVFRMIFSVFLVLFAMILKIIFSWYSKSNNILHPIVLPKWISCREISTSFPRKKISFVKGPGWIFSCFSAEKEKKAAKSQVTSTFFQSKHFRISFFHSFFSRWLCNVGEFFILSIFVSTPLLFQSTCMDGILKAHKVRLVSGGEYEKQSR